jgi:hypothetical protein
LGYTRSDWRTHWSLENIGVKFVEDEWYCCPRVYHFFNPCSWPDCMKIFLWWIRWYRIIVL